MLEAYLIAGFGGQGVLVTGRLIAQAAMDEGLSASWLPSYGPEMRGGTANCITVFSDDEIGSPLASSYDAVLVMNQPSLEKFERQVRPGGTLLVNRSMIPIESSRADVDVHYVDANDIAERVAGSARCANTVLLGALHAVRPRLSSEALIQSLRTAFGAKGVDVVDMNVRAFNRGVEAVGAGTAGV